MLSEWKLQMHHQRTNVHDIGAFGSTAEQPLTSRWPRTHHAQNALNPCLSRANQLQELHFAMGLKRNVASQLAWAAHGVLPISKMQVSRIDLAGES